LPPSSGFMNLDEHSLNHNIG